MKTLKKPLSLLMALFMCLGMFAGTGVTAFAAGETMTTYMVDIPRANDPNKAGWGHPALNFLGGWSTSAGTHFSVHTQDAYNGRAIYCIEPGIGVHSGDQYTGRGEDFWDNYPSSLNPTIPPNTIKEYIGRIMTYGWQGNASTSWMSSNPDHANQMAGYIATQLLVWETIVGERDSQFNHVDANAQGKNNVTEYISAEHPLRSQIFSQYSAIESAVKRHTMLPSFFSSTADAGAYELKWDGEKYSATLTDTNGVLGDYTFSSSTAGLNFSVDGSQLTITSSQALKGSVTVKAEKISAQRSGVVVWTDGVTGGGTQDFATYGTTVSDQMVGYLNLEVKTGNMKLIKTSEDGKVEGISFDKVLEQDETFGIGMNGEITAVTFGLYAQEDITAADGSIIPADGLAGSLQAEQSSLEETKGQLENARAELGAPFAREEELAEKTARLNELNVLLKVDEKDKTLIDSVPDEGEEVPERKVVGLER